MQPQRRIPYHLRKAVSKELEKLQDEDIIQRVNNQPTPWISPIVCTPKKDGSIRLCVDMRGKPGNRARETCHAKKYQILKQMLTDQDFSQKLTCVRPIIS